VCSNTYTQEHLRHAGKLQLHILAALAEFERGRIQERVKAGLARRRRKACALVALDAASLLSDSRRSSVCPNAKPRGDWVSLVLLSSDCTKRDGTGLH